MYKVHSRIIPNLQFYWGMEANKSISFFGSSNSSTDLFENGRQQSGCRLDTSHSGRRRMWNRTPSQWMRTWECSNSFTSLSHCLAACIIIIDHLSFSFSALSAFGSGNNEIYVLYSHHSKYPIFDVHIVCVCFFNYEKFQIIRYCILCVCLFIDVAEWCTFYCTSPIC